MAKRIKLLIIVDTLRIGGAEGQIYELLKGLDKQRYKPVVCSLTSGGTYVEKIRQEGVRVVTIASRFRDVPWNLYKLINLIREEEFDIVHSQMFIPGLFGTLIARSLGVPVVINSVLSLGFVAHRYRRPIKYLLYKLSDCIVVNSERTKSLLLEYQLAGKDKLRTVYNGVDLDRFSPGRNGPRLSKKREEIGLPSADNPIIGMVANLSAVKNHECLLKASRIIVQDFPKATFLIIGDGPLKSELEQLAANLMVRQNVLFLGQRTDTHDLLALMDCSVLCSFREGFSNTILESMASGKPIVATKVGGNPEAILDGVTGFLFDPENYEALAQRVTQLLKHRDLARKMGLAGRRRAEKLFSLGKMVEQYEMLYQSLLKSKGILPSQLSTWACH